MPKFFVASNQIKDDKIEILGDDINHITNVLRMKEDDEITITDKEKNISYYSKIIEIGKDKVICTINEKILETTESDINITIFQGIPKAEKMEYIIQKTTEIGVKHIVIADMKRCIAKISQKDEQKKIQRWQKIAEVASKQSGRDFIPTIDISRNLQEVCNKINEFDIFLVAYEKELDNTLKKELRNNMTAKRIGILIGPEGGLEESEIELLKSAGAKIITLGKRILRTETAPIVLMSNIIYEFEL